MSLTRPNDFPEGGGVDPKDENHPFFSPKKPPLKIYLKPFTQKIVEKYLWLEVLLAIAVFFTGIAEVFGRTLSSGWFFMLGLLTAIVVSKFLHIEDETHRKVMTPPAPEEDKPAEEKK